MNNEDHRLRFPFDRLSPLNRPKNLAGKAAPPTRPGQSQPYRVAGNPVSTLPESAVANCYPGLELDHRNLDSRFFAGLIFIFTDSSDEFTGARLIDIDSSDPELAGETKTQIASFVSEFKPEDAWFLASIEQGSNGPLATRDSNGKPFSGLVVWRLVRSLEAALVRITLEKRGDRKGSRERTTKTFAGHRRVYMDADGRINAAYRPGELQQSLCAPWQHDFRDCTCLYWAANHPDIALGPSPANVGDLEHSPDSEAADPMIMWMRRDRDPDALTLPLRLQQEDRNLEIDYYEINQRWQQLNFVLAGRETPSVYVPDDTAVAVPFDTPKELEDQLVLAAGVELALAAEYLYAMYSLDENAGDSQTQADVLFAKHELLAIAVSEMRHLRWANQIRMELRHTGILSTDFVPVLSAGPRVPCGTKSRNRECIGGYRPTSMEPVSLPRLQDFLDAERPSGTFHGLYARVFSTLRSYHHVPFLTELASRIIADGVRHYSRFSEVRALLSRYLKTESGQAARGIVRSFQKDLAEDSSDYRVVRSLCKEIVTSLGEGYLKGDVEDAANIVRARTAMHDLDEECNRLAAQRPSIGVPLDKFLR